jgi:hypothetical protein
VKAGFYSCCDRDTTKESILSKKLDIMSDKKPGKPSDDQNQSGDVQKQGQGAVRKPAPDGQTTEPSPNRKD